MNPEVVILPPYNKVAEDMGDFFVPQDCKPNTLTIRRGRIKHNTYGVVDCIMLFVPKSELFDWHLTVLSKADGCKWEHSMGFGLSEFMTSEVEKMLGETLPKPRWW